MRMHLYVLLCFTIIIGHSWSVTAEPAKLWAVLVAGSNEWYNYRHQADICHAYQILKQHGVPDEQIIVMMYDDIAYNPLNVWNGTIINHPKGKDVYHGVPKDYTGKHVNPRNFMNILLGYKERMQNIGSGKVLESGPNDHVFINFVDHGAHGLVAFPDSEMTVGELNNTIWQMHSRRKYGKMLIYIEACESGSMFHNHLPPDIKVFATTAANGHESSYACFYDETLNNFLGDCYSVNWMEDVERADLTHETVREQFKLVRQETNTSHVKAFGDRSVSEMVIAEFFGRKTSPRQGPQYAFGDRWPKDATPSRDVPLEILLRQMKSNNKGDQNHLAMDEYHLLLKKRDYFDKFFGELILKMTTGLSVDPNVLMKRSNVQLTQLECHTTLVHSFSTFCFNLGKNPYALKYAYVFTNICEHRLPLDKVLGRMLSMCSIDKKLYHQIQ